MGMPTVNSVGALAASISTIQPAPGTPHSVNDIDILLLSSAGGAITLTTAAGFTSITALNQVTGTETTGARMTVFWRRWNGTDGNPITSDPGNVIIGRMISISGCKTSGDPWNVVAAGTTDAAADMSVSAAGATTTAINCLVLAMCGQALPDSTSTTEFGNPVNASLASLTERIDNATTQGQGQAIWMATGQKAVAGAYSATTCTTVTSSVRVCGSLALEGASDSQPLTGTLYTNTVTFPAGSLDLAVAGTLFSSAPTFPVGAVSLASGPQTLDGVLFESFPVFLSTSEEGGSVTGGNNLFGTLLVNTPTFPQGAITASASITGTLFASTPTFPTGAVTAGYVGGLPAAAIIGIWDARTLSGVHSDPVSSWSDIGPKAQAPLVQAGGSFQPLVSTAGFGGIKSVEFDGDDDRLDLANFDQTYTNDFAFVLVLELLTFPNGTSCCLYSTGTTPDYKNILGVEDSLAPGEWVVMSGAGSPQEHWYGSVLDLSAVPVRVVMVELIRDSGLLRLWERSVLVIDEPDAAFGQPLNNLHHWKVGAREDDTRPTNMRVAYMLLVDMANTDEATLLLARDALGSQFAVPGMDAQGLFGTVHTHTPTFPLGELRETVSQIPNATTSNVGWDTGPTPGQPVHTWIAADDSDYITVTVP